MAVARPTDGYADRLRIALREGPQGTVSVRGLASELGASGSSHAHLRGTSYGGVRQYAEGKVRNPRVELLRAMAEVLGVRGDWLAFGEGPMTEAKARRSEALQKEVEDHNRMIQDAFIREFPAYLHLSFMAQLAMSEVWTSSMVTWVGRSGPSADAIETRGAEEVARLFRAPFDQFGLDPLRMPAIDHYVVLQAEALLTLFSDPSQGQQGAARKTVKKED